ncbi:unnamed protein product [Adineta steineri]|uniref:Aminoglycoside phosphotransferase domain-containing protein n=1 Tax=Adineta steineri TaxID=433720 RepID=A0A814DBV3_9BILA|nr:unnamed protein product [Adineta steineri]CAF0956569.1 unnamed protein product [Adineta steineri]CAF0961610.1 unnamed protein product [Adineta steineri]
MASKWTNVEFLQAKLKDPTIKSCTLTSMKGAGGNSGVMNRLMVTYNNGLTTSYILKVNSEGTEQAAALGLPREALFYDQFASKIKNIVPRTFYSEGDMKAGTKAIVLEDLSVLNKDGCDYVQMGLYFTAHSPLNWEKVQKGEMDSLMLSGYKIEELMRKAFECGADLHATYWNNKALAQDKDLDWLRGHDWYRGEGKDTWQASQSLVQNIWKSETKNISGWDPKFVSLLEASVAKIDWDDFQNRIHNTAFTLVHGDFHPANLMVARKKDSDNVIFGDVKLMDWEVVGVGCGPQDMGQFVISHVPPEIRRKLEKQVFREAYYDKLVEKLKAKTVEKLPTFEECWHEYVYGGVERWVWLLVVCNNIFPKSAGDYFYNQVKDFANDHRVNVETIGMPRA